MHKSLGEFELISRYFQRPSQHAVLGVGDDCAILEPAAGTQFAVACDMLVEGRHFFPGTDARRLGHKALAVNLSDLAAMGAQPSAFLLALALPEVDEAWLGAFSQGLFALAQRQGIELVGGDTTRGPLNLCITVLGVLPRGQALRRDRAQPGDDVWVSGELGAARLALGHLRGEWEIPLTALTASQVRLEQPEPRVGLGLALRGIASAAIDVSDGLLGDLGHVLDASGVGARIDADALPAAPELREQPLARRRACQLAGGDDYELLFTAPPMARAAVQQAALQAATPVTRIGVITAQRGLELHDGQGQHLSAQFQSFDHFREP